MEQIRLHTHFQQVLTALRVPQVHVVRRLKSLGFKTSEASISRLKIRNEWPTQYSDDEIKKCKHEIEAFLIERGATSAHTANLWELPGAVQSEEPKLTPDLFSDNDLEPEMLTNNTKRFFKLRHDPFENEINSEDDVFLADNHAVVLEEILSAANAGSMTALIGECGSGKTILRRAFISRIQHDHPEVILIQPARLDRKKISAESISIAICRALQIQKPGRSAEERDASIERALIESANNGNLHLLVVDEAHDLSVDVIKLFKRIWELTHGFRRVMGIVLIGQTELKKKLENQQVREFTWRCNQITMLPLGVNVPAYVRHKFSRAGSDADAFFDADALSEIRNRCFGKIGQGLGLGSTQMDRSYPLHVNSWLAKAMNLAASIGEPRITAAMVKKVM